MTEDPELLRLNTELASLGRPRLPSMLWVGQQDPKRREEYRRWVAEVLQPWQLANPVAEERFHAIKAAAVKRSDELTAAGLEDAMREQSRAHVKRWAGDVTAIALEAARGTVALDAAKSWWPTDLWALVLSGGPGAGKTLAAAWAARESWVKSGSVRWVNVNEASMEKLFGVEADQHRTAAKNAALLVLDDVGKDKASDMWNSWLESVLDARWRNAQRTVLTSNTAVAALGLDTEPPLKARLGARVWDRLAQGGRMVGCGNVSLRRPERRSA